MEEPNYYKRAILDEIWRKVMSTEISDLQRNFTWRIKNHPPVKRAIGNKWVYKIKYKSDGTIERYKARLVVLGNRQEEGVDYDETFVLVAKMKTI